MAAVLSSRLVKHYSAPCRPLPIPFLLSLRFVRILVLPPLVLFVHLVRTACLAYPVSYARILIRVPIPPSPTSTRSSVLCELLTDVQSQTRKRSERKKIGERKDERSQWLYDDGSLTDLSEVFIRSKKTRNPSFPSFFVCPFVKGNQPQWTCPPRLNGSSFYYNICKDQSHGTGNVQTIPSVH